MIYISRSNESLQKAMFEKNVTYIIVCITQNLTFGIYIYYICFERNRYF